MNTREGYLKTGFGVRVRDYQSVAGNGEYLYVNLLGTSHGYRSDIRKPVTIDRSTVLSLTDAPHATHSNAAENSAMTSNDGVKAAHEHIQYLDTTSNYAAKNPTLRSDVDESITYDVPATRAFPALGLRFQSGVLRTNCVDCLDRTNVGQVRFPILFSFVYCKFICH